MKPLEFLKTTNIIKVAPDEVLSSVLSKLGSSHDAAFVFDDKKFMGVINPYHCLIKSSHPGNAKVENCVFHAPRVMTNFSPAKIMQLMRDSKVHYLPVFDKNTNKFIGIVSARHMLFLLRDESIFHTSIQDVLRLKNRPLLTITEDELVSQALHEFKTKKVSKLVMIGKDMKLRGILTYYDLINFLIAPRKKGHKGDRKGDRLSFQYNPVKNFSKTYVLTLTPQHTLKEALDLILNREIGSVVIVDQEKHPIGILTTRDLLNLFIKDTQDRRIEIIAKNLSEENRRMIGGFFEILKLWTKKIPNLVKMRLFVKEEKHGGVFEEVLSIFPKKGSPFVFKKQGKNLRKLLNQSRAVLKRLTRR